MLGQSLAQFIKQFLVGDGYQIESLMQSNEYWILNVNKGSERFAVCCKGEYGLERTKEYFEKDELGITWSYFLRVDDMNLDERDTVKMTNKYNEILYELLSINQDVCFVD